MDDVCCPDGLRDGYKAVETMVQVLDGETVDEFADSGSDAGARTTRRSAWIPLKTQLH